MLTKYIIEFWNPVIRQYQKGYECSSFEWADKMMHKPYNRQHTRRLVKISTEVLYTEKADANRNKV